MEDPDTVTISAYTEDPTDPNWGRGGNVKIRQVIRHLKIPWVKLSVYIQSQLTALRAQAIARVKQANADAIRIYPALAEKDSPLNKAFVALHQQTKQTNPKLLTNPDWPLTLAKQAASSLGIAPVVVAAPVKQLFGRVRRHLSGGELIVEGELTKPGFHFDVAAGRVEEQSYVLLGYPNGNAIADDKPLPGPESSVYVREAGVHKADGRVYDAVRYAPEGPPK